MLVPAAVVLLADQASKLWATSALSGGERITVIPQLIQFRLTFNPGAASHLLDRLFREPGFARGHVVDFIDYGPFVGNVADIVLVGSCALLMLLSLRGVPFEAPADEERPPS